MLQAYNYIHQGALWAAVTLIVVSAPEFVGATAWLCIQRLLGNIAGGETSSVSVSACYAEVLQSVRCHPPVVGWLACGLVIAVRSAVGLAFLTFAVVVLTSFVRVSSGIRALHVRPCVMQTAVQAEE
jgi:hypothetical protein